MPASSGSVPVSRFGGRSRTSELPANVDLGLDEVELMAEAGTREYAIELVTSMFATLSSGELDELARYFDDETTWTVSSVGRGGPARSGPSAIIDGFLRPVREGLFEPRDPKVNVKNVWVDGEWAFVEAQGSGRLKNGNEYANLYMFCIHIVGGKVREVREYMDTAYAARIAEGIPRPTGAQAGG
jgi:uncharacterized protein